jgi:hypothetical protein
VAALQRGIDTGRFVAGTPDADPAPWLDALRGHLLAVLAAAG